jgi:hypothetical protein
MTKPSSSFRAVDCIIPRLAQHSAALPENRLAQMMTGPRLPFLEFPRCHVEAECIGDDLVKVTNVGRWLLPTSNQPSCRWVVRKVELGEKIQLELRLK